MYQVVRRELDSYNRPYNDDEPGELYANERDAQGYCDRHNKGLKALAEDTYAGQLRDYENWKKRHDLLEAHGMAEPSSRKPPERQNPAKLPGWRSVEVVGLK